MYAVVKTDKDKENADTIWKCLASEIQKPNACLWKCEDAQACLLTQWLQGLQEQLLVLITQDTLALKIGLFHRRKM